MIDTPDPQSLTIAPASAWQHLLGDDFALDSVRYDAPLDRVGQGIRLSGRFLTPTDRAYDAISARAQPLNTQVFFRREAREADEEVIYLVPGSPPAYRPRYALAVGLFIATFASVFFTGAVLMKDPLIPGWFDWRSGLTFALPLMAILLAHELGHFIVGRRHKMAVSPPFFIPLPLPPLGTLGAVILMRTPPKNRRHLLQLGAAGPLAGLVLAIPFLIYGLYTSVIEALPTQPFLLEGNSLSYLGLKWLIFGQRLPANGLDVFLNNIAFAAWAGLLVTALNLIPAGQFDGGHASYTLLGRRWATWLSWALIPLLIFLGIWGGFAGWFLWAAMIYVLGRTHATPHDDITPLDLKHKVLAACMLLLWVLLFVPIPFREVIP